jgi:SAM-dependent methyltransferase
MATHQSLSGTTDEEFVQRMVTSYSDRFGDPFWAFFTTEVGSALPADFVAVDLGCGPGLFLRDLAARYPHATLYGYDLTPAMLAYAEGLDWPARIPTLTVHNVITQPLPLATGSVHLLSMMSVLHLFDDPLTAMAEIRRVLAPNGIFFLRDWIRTPLKDYLEWRQTSGEEDAVVSRQRGFRLFPVHNKYTVEDWEWLLAEAGFSIRSHLQMRPTHRLFVTTVAAEPSGIHA